MERLFKLVPIRYDSYRDIAETKEFQTSIFNIKNMIELYKLGGKVTVPQHDCDIEEMIKLYNNDKSGECATSIRLIKRFDEPDFVNKEYEPTDKRIHQELKEIFNEIFYTEMGYPNFGYIFTKPEGGRFVALSAGDDRFKMISIDKQTFDLLDYIHGMMGHTKTLAIRNELIK